MKSLTSTIDRLDLLHQSQGALTGLPTGFTHLDEYTSGLQGGDLIIIAGRPSMGKTAFALNIAENAALGARKSAADIQHGNVRRAAGLPHGARSARVDQRTLRNGASATTTGRAINGAIQQMAEAPIYIDDTPP